jgi:SAM-dependent methyltransferase
VERKLNICESKNLGEALLMDYTDINADTIDRWVEKGWEWGRPITHEQFMEARGGKWSMLLTPTRPVPREWYPRLQGCRVLGLASGGGQQMPVFAALGAECTVLDYSRRQIDSELRVAEREGYRISAVRADMTKQLPFAADSFDLIFHPVSNCYIEHTMPVWLECRRILKPGGLLMAGLDNGMNFLFDEGGKEIRHRLPFNPLKDRDLMNELAKEDSGVQFSHTLEDQIRGQLKAGLRLLDLYEDTNSSGPLYEYSVPAFWATLAIKPIQ